MHRANYKLLNATLLSSTDYNPASALLVNQLLDKRPPTAYTETRIWHVPAKHANRMDARAHSSSLAECAPRFMTRGTHGFVGQSSPNLAHV